MLSAAAAGTLPELQHSGVYIRRCLIGLRSFFSGKPNVCISLQRRGRSAFPNPIDSLDEAEDGRFDARTEDDSGRCLSHVDVGMSSDGQLFYRAAFTNLRPAAGTPLRTGCFASSALLATVT